MSEGPEVKHIADKIAEAILGKSVVDVQGKAIEHHIREKIIGSKVICGYLWQKYYYPFPRWCISAQSYDDVGKMANLQQAEYDSGKAKPPPRIIWKRKLHKSKSNSRSIEGIIVKNKFEKSI